MDSRKSDGSSLHLERLLYWAVPLALLLASAAMQLLQGRFYFHNPRLQYGIRHLPEALLLTALFAAVAGLLRAVLRRSKHVEERSTFYFLTAIVIAFCLCWLPVLLRGWFVQDDWMLLSAAAIRKLIYIHPGYAWFSLDTVDGNFRPLGTTLYFAYMLKFFGANALAFLSGNFIVNLAGSLVAFFLVRELGYSKIAGAAASLLYMTRGMLYTQNAWACALGDGIVILLGGLAILGILRANKRQGFSAFAYHLLAWVLFCIALFAKQSSFSIPLIAALAVLLRPGEDRLVRLRRRVARAVLILIAYSIPVAVVFFHAKALLRHGTPYPLSLTLGGFGQLFAYIPWYFVAVGFPGRYKLLNTLVLIAGAVILAGFAIFVARVPRALGRRPRDIVFLLLAALAAISPYVLTPTRVAPYYGAMSAFWLSLALGIAVTQFGGVAEKGRSARNAYLALYLLVILGALDIRLKQTGLVPSGGYIWGTYGMDQEKSTYDQLVRALAQSPARHTLVLVNFPADGKFQASMALFADPGLRRILVYDPKTGKYLSNDLAGARPRDEFGALNDAQAYNWNLPISSFEAASAAAPGQAVWVVLDGGHIHSIDPGDLMPKQAK